MKEKWMENDVIGCLVGRKREIKGKYERLKLLWDTPTFIFLKSE